MTNITKAAKQALAELADWHWSQATTLRKAACTSAMDKPEPGQSSLTRMADWHDTQKSIISSALQDKAGEVKCQTCNGHGLVGGYMQDGSGYGEPCPDCNAPQVPAPVDELIEALEDLMDWQVKNVALWHNRAYDRAHRAIKKHRAALSQPAPAPQPTVPVGPKCRDCADFGPICPNSGKPCNSQQQPAVPVVSDAQIIRAAVSAMPSTNPLVAEDLIGGHTMHTEAEDIVAIWKAGVQWQALHTATPSCGHPASLIIRSAESGEALYCETCDDKSGRRDAEMREAELLEANQKLRDEILALRPATLSAEFDVRNIMLDVVPGDGSGFEVYAKNVSDVERVLSEMDEKLESLLCEKACPPLEDTMLLNWLESNPATTVTEEGAQWFLGELPCQSLRDAIRKGILSQTQAAKEPT